MLIRTLSPTYAISGQIYPDDIPAIKAAGYRSIMCNRPDGETYDQPNAEDIAKVARQHGMRFYHVPVSGRAIDMKTLKGILRVLRVEKQPLLAYCQTGRRCQYVWEAVNL